MNAAVAAPTLLPGRPWPLGATVREGGINFAVCSGHATAIELCLFDESGQHATARLALPGHSGDVWHGFWPGAAPPLVTCGPLYGFRAHGPWRPDHGHFFNPHKLLLDPWGREIVGAFDWSDQHFAADRQHPLHMDTRDNGPHALKSRVVHEVFDWQGDTRPHRALEDSVIYEVHLRNFTQLMPGVPETLRGSYLGLAHPAAVAHLQRLGITAVSLLPLQQHLDEEQLVRRGLTNHWGYNTLGFFCPEPRYAAPGPGEPGARAREQLRHMVRALHAAGIEVLLDVVYNHTAEGDERGPSLSWRGLDHRNWYRLAPPAFAHCENYSGCGNTLDLRHPRALQFVLDSLRHWVSEFHVDGFRFDLAPVLGRGHAGFERDGAFFKAVAQDPVLAGVKLIAEPWDLGPEGYQVGQFPRGWLEWNDRFRDTLRRFWLEGDVTRGELAQRFAGSADLYQRRQRPPAESVNYVVSHDGFTLRDLVSYEQRRNHANGENNQDGTGHNLSWNCGQEGETDDAEVSLRRARLQRALLASTLLAQGTPMFHAGDELGHSQGGNNNPYAQDNAISWIEWAHADEALIEFTAHVIALRRRLKPFANRWYSGLPDERGLQDLAWVRRHGAGLNADEWNRRGSRILGVWIGRPGGGGDGIDAVAGSVASADTAGQPLLLIVNARDFDSPFLLPPGRWMGELDSAELDGQWRGPAVMEHEAHIRSRSLLLLRDVSR